LNARLEFGLAADTYHASPGVSNTMLSAMRKSPAHCWALHLDPTRPRATSTAAQSAGSLAHTAILEPDTLLQRYVVRPDGMTFQTNAGKAWRDAQTLPIVSLDDLLQAEAQRNALMRVPVLRDLLSNGIAESSAFWTDKTTGLQCRARPDWLHHHEPKCVTVLDIKTISELTPESIARAIATYGYHRQDAHYTAGVEATGLKVEAFVFGFVSSTYPFLAVAHVLDDDTREQGRDEVAELLERFAHCQKVGEWPAFGDGYQLIGLPAWARRSNEVEVSYE
jgi:hypothetical protein